MSAPRDATWPEGDAFLEELNTLTKPSSSKINLIADLGVSLYRQYKLVVHHLEKFIKKTTRDTRLNGLYVLDAVLRRSRHKFGDAPGKDPFATRLSQNMLLTFAKLIEVRSFDLPRVHKVLQGWRAKSFFPADLQEEMEAIFAAAQQAANPDDDEAADEEERKQIAAEQQRSAAGGDRSPVPPLGDSSSPARDSSTPQQAQRGLPQAAESVRDPRSLRDPRRAAHAASQPPPAAAPAAAAPLANTAMANLQSMLAAAGTPVPSVTPAAAAPVAPAAVPVAPAAVPVAPAAVPAAPTAWPPAPVAAAAPPPPPAAVAVPESFDWGYDDEDDDEEDEEARKEKLRVRLEQEKERMDVQQATNASDLVSPKAAAAAAAGVPPSPAGHMQQPFGYPGPPGGGVAAPAPHPGANGAPGAVPARRSRFGAPKSQAEVAAELAAQGYAQQPSLAHQGSQERRRSRSRSRERDNVRPGGGMGGGGGGRGQTSSNQGFVLLPDSEQDDPHYARVLSTTLRIGHPPLAQMGLDQASMRALLQQQYSACGAKSDWFNISDSQTYTRFASRRDAVKARQGLGSAITLVPGLAGAEALPLTWAKGKEMEKDRSHWVMFSGEGKVDREAHGALLDRTPSEMPGEDDDWTVRKRGGGGGGRRQQHHQSQQDTSSMAGYASSAAPSRSGGPESYPVPGWTPPVAPTTVYGSSAAQSYGQQLQQPQQQQQQFGYPQQMQPPAMAIAQPPPPQAAPTGGPKLFTHPSRPWMQQQ